MKTLLTHPVNAQLDKILDELRHGFTELYGDRLTHLILFGSQARGDATPESDIDVLIVLRGTINPGDEITRTGKLTADLSLKYNVVISSVFIGVDRYLTEQSPLLINVHRE
jgi:uncharacterized protein